jgi:hypothetical protein
MVKVKVDLKGTGSKGMGWIHLVQDRAQLRGLTGTVVYVRVPLKGNFLARKTVSAS